MAEEYRNLSVKRNGDILEVKLRDSSFNPYFSRNVRINDKKKIKELVEDLQDKGVNFPINWF